MYEPFFGMNRRPFAATPDPGCFFAAPPMQEALNELLLCVRRGQGIGILTAPAGMGKTLLCQRLSQDLTNEFQTVFLGNSNFPTRRSLLQAILFELGDDYSRRDESELRLDLKSRLRGSQREHTALALIIDEAHLFANELLEEVRTLADLAHNGVPLVRVILSAQPDLEERLTTRDLDAINQRLSNHVYLEPLTISESIGYLKHRIEWAGGAPRDVFEEDSLSIVARASGGLPRCLNQLADHSLLLAFAEDEKPVAEKTVREALDDLKQLPLQWNDVNDGVATFGWQDEFSDNDGDHDEFLTEAQTLNKSESIERSSVDDGSSDEPVWTESAQFEFGPRADGNCKTQNVASPQNCEPRDQREEPLPVVSTQHGQPVAIEFGYDVETASKHNTEPSNAAAFEFGADMDESSAVCNAPINDEIEPDSDEAATADSSDVAVTEDADTEDEAKSIVLKQADASSEEPEPLIDAAAHEFAFDFDDDDIPPALPVEQITGINFQITADGMFVRRTSESDRVARPDVPESAPETSEPEASASTSAEVSGQDNEDVSVEPRTGPTISDAADVVACPAKSECDSQPLLNSVEFDDSEPVSSESQTNEESSMNTAGSSALQYEFNNASPSKQSLNATNESAQNFGTVGRGVSQFCSATGFEEVIVEDPYALIEDPSLSGIVWNLHRPARPVLSVVSQDPADSDLNHDVSDGVFLEACSNSDISHTGAEESESSEPQLTAAENDDLQHSLQAAAADFCEASDDHCSGSDDEVESIPYRPLSVTSDDDSANVEKIADRSRSSVEGLRKIGSIKVSLPESDPETADDDDSFGAGIYDEFADDLDVVMPGDDQGIVSMRDYVADLGNDRRNDREAASIGTESRPSDALANDAQDDVVMDDDAQDDVVMPLQAGFSHASEIDAEELIARFNVSPSPATEGGSTGKPTGSRSATDGQGDNDHSVRVSRPDMFLDAIVPLLGELDDDDTPVAGSNRPMIDIEAELLKEVHYGSDAIEDQIGATVLDMCLDTRMAVNELRDRAGQFQDTDPSSASNDKSSFDDELNDIVEPEFIQPKPVPRAERQQLTSGPVSQDSPKPRAPGKASRRPLGRLFSELRKRQREE